MKRRRSRLLFRLPLLIASALSLLSGPANAENPRVTEKTDFWFTFSEPTTFFARTYAVEGISSDPMLWLYDSAGQLLAQNDDYYGLQSRLELQVPAGTYRLRAGVCCGDPERWYQGVQYDITYNGIAFTPSTTTEVSTSTTGVPTTLETTTTTTSSTSTSTTTTTTTTTTTVPEVTTTWLTTTTSVLTPIATVTTTVPETVTIAPLIPQEQSNDLEATTTTSVPVVASATTTPTTTTTTPTPTTTPELVTTVPTTTVPPNDALEASEGAIRALQDEEELTVEALEEVLDDIQVSELTEEQEAQLVAVLNIASEEVKKAFEKEINVFAEGLDDYVPSGSTVPVKTRRVLIATTGLLIAMPTATPTEVRRRK